MYFCEQSSQEQALINRLASLLADECEWYVVKLEGESPLRALVRRTVREGKGVHREVESEESRIQNTDLNVQSRAYRQRLLG